MRSPDFQRLARDLEAVGAAPAVIRRTIEELQNHLDDAEAAAIEAGLDGPAARRAAYRALGQRKRIVAEIAARPQLLSWRRRWPQAASCVDTVSYCALWPVTPFVYCATHPAGIVRWGVSSSLAACVTGTLLFAMQWLVRSGGGF